MALTVPFTFGPLTGPIPLSDLDANYSAVTGWINARNPTVGPIASRPAAGNAGAIWVASDQGFILYVDDGAAWDRTDLPGPRVLNSASSQTGANTTETDALNFSLPGNTLANNFDSVEVVFRLRTAANANTKRFRVYFGAAIPLDTGAQAWNGAAAWSSTTIHRTGAATEKAVAFWERGSSGLEVAANIGALISTPAETLSGAITIRVTMQNGTASAADCVVDFAQVRFWPAS